MGLDFDARWGQTCACASRGPSSTSLAMLTEIPIHFAAAKSCRLGVRLRVGDLFGHK
jgi:hypothetical protein